MRGNERQRLGDLPLLRTLIDLWVGLSLNEAPPIPTDKHYGRALPAPGKKSPGDRLRGGPQCQPDRLRPGPRPRWLRRAQVGVTNSPRQQPQSGRDPTKDPSRLGQAV